MGARTRRRATAVDRPDARPSARGRRCRRRSARRRTMRECPATAPPRPQVLVEDAPRLPNGTPSAVVLVPVPADGRLHDETTFREQVERAELTREQQRVAERGDHGAGGEPHPRRRGGDRGEQHERARPRHRGILVPRQRVVAGVAHDPVRPGARAEDDVLADHHRVEAGFLGDTAISTRARRSRGGVSVQFSLRTRTSRGALTAARPATSAAAASTAARWCGRELLARNRREVGERIVDPGREAGERLDHREPAERHVTGRVAALVRGDEPALAEPSSPRRAGARPSRRRPRPAAACGRAGRARRRRSRTRSR